MLEQQRPPVTPERIMQIGMGFQPARVLQIAVRRGIFTKLGEQPRSADMLIEDYGFNPRIVEDFMDSLVAMKFLDRDEEGLYYNTPEAAILLDQNSPAYAGGLVGGRAYDLYRFWGDLDEALMTGKPQSEAKYGINSFEELYKYPDRVRMFMKSMEGLNLGTTRALVGMGIWNQFSEVMDIGCANGFLLEALVRKHSHLNGKGVDLSQVKPYFEENIQDHDLQGRINFHTADIFADPLPEHSDLKRMVTLTHFLHDFSDEQKLFILDKVYESSKPGDSIIVGDWLIDDERKESLAAFMMSLNMGVVTFGGRDYTAKEGKGWLESVGYQDIQKTHLAGPDFALIAHKN